VALTTREKALIIHCWSICTNVLLSEHGIDAIPPAQAFAQSEGVSIDLMVQAVKETWPIMDTLIPLLQRLKAIADQHKGGDHE
jgi:hypothetical protein